MVDRRGALAVGLRPGRTFGTDSETLAQTALLSLRVDRTISGSATDSVALEILVASDDAIDRLSTLKPDESGLYFLRNKGSEVRSLGLPEDLAVRESEYYRLLFSEAVFRNFSGSVAVKPGAESGLRRNEGVAFNDLLGTVETIVERTP